MSRDPVLSAFLSAAAKRPFSWGEWDCLQWLGFWVAIRRGVDPGSRWRGRYRGKIEAARIVSRAGGFVAHMEACLAPLGIERASEPNQGDIAAVEGPQGKTGAIWTGKHFAVIGSEKLFLLNSETPLLAAWRV